MTEVHDKLKGIEANLKEIGVSALNYPAALVGDTFMVIEFEVLHRTGFCWLSYKFSNNDANQQFNRGVWINQLKLYKKIRLPTALLRLK